MHDYIDRQWGGSRSVYLHYSKVSSTNRYVRIESSAGIESESDYEPHEEAKHLTAAQILLQSTIEMREQLRPIALPMAEQTIIYIGRKVKPTIVKELGPRAAQILQTISLGEQEPLLFFDDTYQVLAYNMISKEIVGNLPHSAF